MAQYGHNAVGKLRAALIISVPMNIFEATKSIEKPYLNLMLNKYLCDNLQRILRRHVGEEGFPDLDVKEVYKVRWSLYLLLTNWIKKTRTRNLPLRKLQSKTVREFDEKFTSRHFGYRDAEHYYSNATLHNKLHLVEVPLLCLSAADDPFQPLQGE